MKTSSLVLWHSLAFQVPSSSTRTFCTYGGQEYRVDYLPAESNTGMFGGNSNWRGPVWMPGQRADYPGAPELLFVLRRQLQNRMSHGLRQADEPFRGCSKELSSRLTRIFMRDEQGRRPVYGGTEKFQSDPNLA